MRNYVSKNVKLPCSILSGSVLKRDYAAKELTENFYQNLVSGLNNESVTSRHYIARNMRNSLPGNIKFRLNRVEKSGDSAAYMTTWDDEHFKLDLYELTLVDEYSVFDKSVNRRRGKKFKNIKVGYLPAIMHEFQHISDHICNPKHSARLQKMLPDPKSYDLEYFYANYLYDTFINNPIAKRLYMIFLKFKLKSFIKKASEERVIDYLQFMRYSLMSEKNAYWAENYYACRLLRDTGIPTQVSRYDGEDFMFDEKIELLNEFIAKEISRQRATNRK